MIADPICPYCGAPATLVDSAVIYGGRSYGPAWACVSYPECDAYVGCHPGTNTPLGRMADKTLRQAKMKAHEAFDPLWKAKMRRFNIGKGRARRDGYFWLAKQMGLHPDDTHIGMFDADQCRRVVEVCARFNGDKAR